MNFFFRRSTNPGQAVDHLAALIEQREQDGATWQRAIQEVCKKAEQATTEEIVQTQQRLAEMMMQVPLILSSFFALASGALIERGADAAIPAQAIFQRTSEALILATQFGKACLEQAKEEQKKSDEDEETAPGIEECVEQYGSSLARHMGEEALGWQALDFLTRAVFAVVIHSSQQRILARSNATFLEALQNCQANTLLRCLRTALNLLEQEKMIVLHPELRRGYHIRINNLGLNFELHTLLADAFIGDPVQGWLPGTRPDPRVVAAAKDGPFPMPGEKEAAHFPQAEGAFNLWNWRGLQPDGRLPQGFNGKEHWIWNEGQPADIDVFEGTRIILLGPPPYHRRWNAGRFFPQLKGELEVLMQLPETQVEQWLTRIASAAAIR